MIGNPLVGQVLGGLFGQALGRRGMGGALGGGLGGVAMGSVLGSVLGGASRGRMAGASRGGGTRTALLLMLLPLAMRWVQRQGGMGAVLDRFRQQGYGRHAQSWVGSGTNDGVDDQAVQQVVGQDELRAMAQRLGVPEQEVAHAFAEILPEMVDKLSPEGRMPAQADDVLDESRQALEQHIQDVEYRETTTTPR